MILLTIADTTPVVPSVPTMIGFAAAAVASFVSNLLRGDGLPAKLNALIAAAVFLILTAICMVLIRGFSGNWRDDAVYFISLAVVMAGKELVDLLQIVYQARSLLAPRQEQEPVTPMVRRASRGDQ